MIWLGRAVAGCVSVCAADLAGVCWTCWAGIALAASNTVASDIRCRGAMISSRCSNRDVNQAPEDFPDDIPFKSDPHFSGARPWTWGTVTCPLSCFDAF